MATLGSYTTTDAVRGCLGIDANDAPDRYMLDSRVDLELKIELDDWLPTHAALYLAGTTGSPTTQQTAISDRISLYAQWFVALEFANRPMAVPLMTTDGKAQVERYVVDQDKIAELAAKKVAKYKRDLQILVNGADPILPYARFVGVAIPGDDPILVGIE